MMMVAVQDLSPEMDELERKRLEDDLNIVEWGRWMGGGWPNGRSGRAREPNISDDDALRLQALVNALPPMTKDVICEIYIYRKGIIELCSQYRVSNRVIADYRDAGLNKLHGAIFLAKSLVKKFKTH